jgi:hypothetical protein
MEEGGDDVVREGVDLGHKEPSFIVYPLTQPVDEDGEETGHHHGVQGDLPVPQDHKSEAEEEEHKVGLIRIYCICG